jgi:hypothetical protein
MEGLFLGDLGKLSADHQKKSGAFSLLDALGLIESISERRQSWMQHCLTLRTSSEPCEGRDKQFLAPHSGQVIFGAKRRHFWWPMRARIT